MSEPSESKPYDIFTRVRKASIAEATISSAVAKVVNEANSMANIADVLAGVEVPPLGLWIKTGQH